ncbi:hypothetical protein CEY16_06225 [Halalkalibacillus sediminis]|uniref:NERD domain-containing protein n=1 Tax=Halalkalibacillus sediminis TaxID=2018042 RepID=A0A2I0QYC0_9BACI|nr:hypothetical protein [Halalkalibacillus sediminis]PKR79335.1 hypothetical protein CEY16_06225 [Halalkalibacillus sediminis]
MAQLIKLQDYISRYESDIFQYTGQFIRFKKENYSSIHEQWQQHLSGDLIFDEPKEEKENSSRLKKWWRRNKEKEDIDVEEPVIHWPETELELKHQFLDKVFAFQLKWASSTLQEVSFLDKMYEQDERLKYFLQRFPDTFLILYQPIFKLKNAAVEAEVIIVTPAKIMCLSLLENSDDEAYYEAVDERKWNVVENQEERTIVSPMIGLKRMEKTIHSILDLKGLEYPVEKVILSESHHVTHQQKLYKTQVIDSKNYQQWFQEHRRTSYPLKHQQLKIAEALLQHTQKTSIKRPVWEDDDDVFSEE